MWYGQLWQSLGREPQPDRQTVRTEVPSYFKQSARWVLNMLCEKGIEDGFLWRQLDLDLLIEESIIAFLRVHQSQ